MKKVFVVTLTALSLFISSICVWADADLSEKVEPEVELQYVYFTRAYPTLSISTSGIANCKMEMPLKPEKTVDYGQVTAYLKKNMGTTIKTFNAKVYPSAGKLTWKDTYDLNSYGSYYLVVEVKCYKGGKLVETVKEQSEVDTY